MLSKLLTYIDLFIATDAKPHNDKLYKSRLLVGMILSFVASVIIFAPVFTFLPGLGGDAISAYYKIATPFLIIWVTLLYALKHNLPFTLCSHAAIASVVALLFGAVIVTGGPLKTEVHPLLMVPMVIGFLLLSKRGGLIWITTTAIIYIVLSIIAFWGVSYINLPDEEVKGPLRVFNWSCAFIIIAALLALYENLHQRLKSERDEEREKFRDMAEVAIESSIMNNSTDILASTGGQLLDSVLQQKTALDQLSATTEELGATASKNSETARDVKLAISDTEQTLIVSQAATLQLLEAIKTLESSSQQIQSINNVINDISYQTNLLSLNAMIEASRAGDNSSSGGFKVVALEVKKLAERSAGAAAEINLLLSENFSAVKLGVELSENMRARFNDIQEKITPLSTSVSKVASASVEQDQAIGQIMIGLGSINQSVDDNQLLAEQLSNNANALKDNSEKLMKVVANLDF